MVLRYFFALLTAAFSLFPVLAGAQSLIAPTDKFPHYLQHYVRERETPSSIAHDFNVKTKDFLALNNFPENVRLKPGQIVMIRLLKDGEPQSNEAPYVPATSDEPVKNEQPATYEKTTTKTTTTVRTERPAPAERTEKPAVTERVERTKTVTKTETTTKASSGGTVETGPNGVQYERSTTGYHTVAKGQTFYHIAVMYGLNVDKLKALNNMSNTNIEIGQKLKVSQ